MKTRVLIVDDSVVFRSQIKAALEGAALIEVVGVAANGRLAIEKMTQMPVDVITLDLEMPEMNGLETLVEMKRRGIKTRVVVFASKTTSGADLALQALRSGADDVVAKPSFDQESVETPADRIRAELLPKILQFHQEAAPSASPKPVVESSPSGGASKPIPIRAWPNIDVSRFSPTAIVIASSTGGPDALEKIFSGIGDSTQCPILIVQHMPPVFTKSLAKRLESISGIKADEASQWEPIVANRIYVAPGDFHMSIHQDEKGPRIRLDQGPPRNCVRPAADGLFESAAKSFGRGCMGFVLTGMGSDGLIGAQAVKDGGGAIMIQNEKSCIVFGMPGAVFAAGAFDAVGDLESIRKTLQKMMLPQVRHKLLVN